MNRRFRFRRNSFPALLATFLAGACLAPVRAEFYNDHDDPPHNYETRELHDPMTLLVRELEAGRIVMDEPVGKPLVERLLEDLDLHPATQVLVFTKTSLQRTAVSPRNPRAIYFNDRVYLGWMPDGRIEIASFDPEVGPIFYFQRPLDDTKAPLFARTRRCLGCHAGDDTHFMPGAMGLSVFPDDTGRSMKRVPKFRRAGHQIPWEDRWGGWYVTGKHGDMRHMGNATATRNALGLRIDRDRHANLESLDEFFPTGQFPAKGSDVVALMVFDHQISMHHEIVEGSYRARQALYDSKLAPDETDRSKLTPVSEELLATGIDRMIDYLLFREEISLGAGIVGDPAFREAFAADKRTDRRGRSLKDLRLDGRIFEFRCSYMIYSPSFTALPPIMKNAVYERLHEILTADEPVEGFEYLGAEERRAIHEILRGTMDDLPAAWREG